MASSSNSDAYREKPLRLGHKIFLSYSGADQKFVRKLYHILLNHNYNPFFDQESLPKAVPVSMGNILQEAAHSELAVFFLSEDFFTRNKNPLMEVVECIKHRVKLLPLFYKIPVDKVKENKESWYNAKWSEWGVNRDQFREAVKTLLHISGIDNREGLPGTEYRRMVLQEIQKILPPEILSDVSNICGGDRLAKVVKGMFNQFSSEGVSTHCTQVLGLHGPSGTGKSSLCKILEHSASLFDCQVCYIKLDNAVDETAQLVRMKKFIGYVTNLSGDFMDKLQNIDQAQKMLIERQFEKVVFLIIDNVTTSESSKEAKRYLDGRCRFKTGSRVLVTAHTENVLSGFDVNRDLKWHIAAMPDLTMQEATQILCKIAGSIPVEDDVVERCLNLCCFQKGRGKGHHYHPLMLNALAESLTENQKDIRSWITALESSFSYTDAEAKQQVLQQMLRSTSYDLLLDLQKQVFLDVAFYLPSFFQCRDDILEWLEMVHGTNIREAVRILERRGLIDMSALLGYKDVNLSDRKDINLSDPDFFYFSACYKGSLMHDLYYEMACLIREEKGTKCLFFQGDGSDKELSPHCCCEELKRVRIDNCLFSSDLVLRHHFPSVQVLDVRCYEGMGKLDLRGAVCLRSLNLFNTLDSFVEILGLDDCDSLFHLSVVDAEDMTGELLSNVTLPTFDYDNFPASRKRRREHFRKLRNFILVSPWVFLNAPFDFSSYIHIEKLVLARVGMPAQVFPTLRNLRVLNFLCDHSDFHAHDLVEHDFGPKIESICIVNCNHVMALRELNHNCSSIRRLEMLGCSALKDIEGLGQLTSLQCLVLGDCPALKDIEGLGQLTSLQSLDLVVCSGLKDIEGLGQLTSLQSLYLEDCPALKDIEGLGQLTSLQSLYLHGCSGLKDIEGLGQLTSLQSLHLDDCSGIKDIEDLGQFPSLQTLELSDHPALKDIEGLGQSTSLRRLDLRECPALKDIEGLGQSTSLQSLFLSDCPALKDIEVLGQLTSLKYVWLLNLHITSLPKHLLKLGKQLRSLRINQCYFIEPEDRIAVLSTPDLPKHTYRGIITDILAMVPFDLWIMVMLPAINGIWLKISDPSEFLIPPSVRSDSLETLWWDVDSVPSTLWNQESWEKILSLLVESKEALDTISRLIRHMHMSEEKMKKKKIVVLALVLHLCVGGRYVHLKDLLSEPHVVEACIEAQHPLGLIVLALAKQHFGADLESRPWHPAAIAAMVANAFLDQYWDKCPVSGFQLCAQECAASIAMSNAWILEKLPPIAQYLVHHYYNTCSCYDGTQVLNYVFRSTDSVNKGNNTLGLGVDWDLWLPPTLLPNI